MSYDVFTSRCGVKRDIFENLPSKCHYHSFYSCVASSLVAKLWTESGGRGHDRIAAAVHWGLAKKYGLPHAEKWYDHKAEAVSENEDVKLLSDFSIQTDKVIHARRPNIIIEKKKDKECMIIDVAVQKLKETNSNVKVAFHQIIKD